MRIDKISDYYNKVKETLKPKEYIDKEIYWGKAYILKEQENYEEALKYISKAIEINPKSIDYYDIRSEILYKLKDYKNAIEDYTKLIENNPKPKFFLSKIAKSVEYYDRGVSKFWLNDYKGAIEDYTIAIKLNPKNYVYYFEKGKAKTWIQDYKGAIEDYTEALRLNPNHYGIYFERAIVNYNCGNKNLSMNDINTAINLMKNSNIEHYTDGEILSTKAIFLFEKDKNKALDFLVDVQKNCKKDKDKLYVELSYIFFSYENYKKALKYANLAILNNRENPNAYYRKKCALEALGRKEEARECFEKAIKLGYQEKT